MNELTKWFDGSKFVPEHVGVYETSVEGRFKCFQKWNGFFWCTYDFSVDKADSDKNKNESYYQNNNWRGLANKP